MHRGAISEIDLGALSHNLSTVKKLTGNLPVIAVVKADAYGHGAVEISKRLLADGVFCLAVAYTSEAVMLRGAGIRCPILVLFDKRDVTEYFEYDLVPVVHDIEAARRFSKEAEKRGRPLDIHIKVDTGMGRIGFNNEGLREEVIAISRMEYLTIRGLMSHFSDSDVSDKSYALSQLKSFNELRERLIQQRTVGHQQSAIGNNPPSSPLNLRGEQRGVTHDSRLTIHDSRLICHMANSAAVLSLKDAHMDAVRPGLMLYGHSPFAPKIPLSLTLSPKGRGDLEFLDGDAHCAPPSSEYISPPLRGGNAGEGESLKPVMTVKTEILSLRKVKKGTPISYGRTFITRRDSLIAVLPVGYADGFSRRLSNTLDVLVGRKRAPVVGRICMDLMMADVTEIRDVKEGDEVVLLGRQGDEEITAWEMAMKSGTVPYEILTTIGSRSRRVYKG